MGIVRNVFFPASKQDADPFKGQSPYGNVVTLASGDLGLIAGLSPGAETDRVSSELVERLSLELWAGPSEAKTPERLPLAMRMGATPLKFNKSPTTWKRPRSVPKAVNNRGVSAGPAPGKFSKRKRSG